MLQAKSKKLSHTGKSAPLLHSCQYFFVKGIFGCNIENILRILPSIVIAAALIQVELQILFP